MQNKSRHPPNRTELFKELEKRYCNTSQFVHRLLYVRKRYAWIFVVAGSRLLKRILDFSLALFLLMLLSPVMAAIATLIKLYDGGPILYVKPRVGRYGKEFPFPKFRSMRVNADKEKASLANSNKHEEGVTFKMKKDPRVTPIGRWLRGSSLDELPQLWSVLIGHMSLVGPRPPLPEEVELYSLHERRRLNMLPGITCIWQTSGRSDIPFPEQVSLDLQYIESQSLWLDIKLLLKTIPAVILGKGAY